MTAMSRILAVSSLFTIAACANGEKAPAAAAQPAPVVARANLSLADGTPVGTANIRRQRKGLILSISATGLATGEHGAHIHAIGDCSASDFKSAGGHLNPQMRQHGMENPAGSHLGDLPNLVAGEDGKAQLDFPLAGDSVQLLDEILDGDGAAIVIHAGADDNRSDPSGNSGGRVACGVLQAAT